MERGMIPGGAENNAQICGDLKGWETKHGVHQDRGDLEILASWSVCPKRPRASPTTMVSRALPNTALVKGLRLLNEVLMWSPDLRTALTCDYNGHTLLQSYLKDFLK